jgi:hypothetical protein
MNNDNLLKLRARICLLQKIYAMLFLGSLLMLMLMWFVVGRTPFTYGVWIVLLGGAVLVRLYRTSLVNKYNETTTGQLR